MDSGKKKRTRKEYEREKKEEGPREGIPEREQEPLYEEGSDEEEAIEDVRIVESEDERPESVEDGEDLMDKLGKDYVGIPELDKYEISKADEEELSKMSESARRAAERELSERDRERVREQPRHGRKFPAALMRELEESDEDDELQRELRREKARIQFGGEGHPMEIEHEDDRYLDMEESKGSLSVWISQPRTQRWVRRMFSEFLRNFRDNKNTPVYENRIIEMCTNNKQSLEITYTHLSNKNPTLALWTAEEPTQILPLLDEVAFELVTDIFPQYDNIAKEVFVRIRDLPIVDNLRDLRQDHLNGLVKIKGVVTKRTAVYPQLKKMYFLCSKCGDRKGPIYHNENVNIKLGSCILCQTNGPFVLDEEETVYRNYQRITIQETPGSVPAGRVPRQKDVILLNDNIDIVRPGDEAEITGIYTHKLNFGLNVKHGFPIFSTLIEANYIKRMGDLEVAELTEQDKVECRRLSKKPNIGDKIIKSLARSIYGHEFVKTALALAMFGGVAKDVAGKHKIRGDINVLLLGDPGTAKSQFLKYVEQTSHRVVYTTGKGASAVGLTAGVRRDPVSREWSLEGGALVLADKGICLIDEFDKMNDQDRTSIHEAMEQQTISISKAGIVTSLQARCSVIAAANPLKGRYDNQLNFSENVDLTEPILSRFDILAVIKDEIDTIADHALSSFVINNHIKNHPDITDDEKQESVLEQVVQDEEDIISQEMLKKYITYARKFIQPKLSDVDKEKISKFYAEIRKESTRVGGMLVSVRHIESLLRMAESHAKMHLREYVRSDDVDLAISILLKSFLMSQKYSVARALEKKFAPFLTKQQDTTQYLLHILDRMARDQIQYLKYVKDKSAIGEIEVSSDAFEKEARDYNIHDLGLFFNSKAFNQKFILSKVKKVIVVKDSSNY